MFGRLAIMNAKRSETRTHTDQMIEGLLLTLRALIPGVSVHCQTVDSVDHLTEPGFVRRGVGGQAGHCSRDGEISIWFDLSHGRICLLQLTRRHVPFTQAEKSLLGRFPDALNGLLVSHAPRAIELAQRIAARVSVETLLIARYLRGGKATTYWTPALVLEELQRLTFRRYEGNPCTSGFVYSSKPDLYAARFPVDEYQFVPFSQPVTLKANKLSSPASFRYVDGQNAFYVIDNIQRIRGFCIAADPKRFNLIERCSCAHLVPLVRTMPGRVWAAFVGRNNDVNVVAGRDLHLRWDGNHWRLLDASILTSLLEAHGCTPRLSREVTLVCRALSDLRSGTVILFPDDESRSLEPAGTIDDSDLGKALRSALVDQTLSDLATSNALIGLLTSDGLTTISKTGRILACGEIVNIGAAAQEQPAGGGRTHAAVSASTIGLALKVSEDGPISVFKHGRRLIEI